MQGLWAKCENCDEIIYRQELEKNSQRLPAL
jgi:acetyl-CoA carboxylase carboxyl transferase subunit beta